MKPLTYRDAGVDIEAGDEAVRRIAPLARTTFRPEVLGGIGERGRIVDGSAVKPGDAVLGLASSGLHSNGYTLARRIVFDVLKLDVGAPLPGTGRSVGDELLEPTRIYASAVRALLAAVPVSAMANVTGGGLTGNVPRVLPDGCRVVLRRGAWREPPVFATLREAGRVSEPEMLRTFNLGVGYVVIVRAADADRARKGLTEAGETATGSGGRVAGQGGVELV